MILARGRQRRAITADDGTVILKYLKCVDPETKTLDACLGVARKAGYQDYDFLAPLAVCANCGPGQGHNAAAGDAIKGWAICVQVVYKKEGLKGLKMDLSNAESTTDS